MRNTFQNHYKMVAEFYLIGVVKIGTVAMEYIDVLWQVFFPYYFGFLLLINLCAIIHSVIYKKPVHIIYFLVFYQRCVHTMFFGWFLKRMDLASHVEKVWIAFDEYNFPLAYKWSQFFIPEDSFSKVFDPIRFLEFDLRDHALDDLDKAEQISRDVDKDLRDIHKTSSKFTGKLHIKDHNAELLKTFPKNRLPLVHFSMLSDFEKKLVPLLLKGATCALRGSLFNRVYSSSPSLAVEALELLSVEQTSLWSASDTCFVFDPANLLEAQKHNNAWDSYLEINAPGHFIYDRFEQEVDLWPFPVTDLLRNNDSFLLVSYREKFEERAHDWIASVTDVKSIEENDWWDHLKFLRDDGCFTHFNDVGGPGYLDYDWLHRIFRLISAPRLLYICRPLRESFTGEVVIDEHWAENVTNIEVKDIKPVTPLMDDMFQEIDALFKTVDVDEQEYLEHTHTIMEKRIDSAYKEFKPLISEGDREVNWTYLDFWYDIYAHGDPDDPDAVNYSETVSQDQRANSVRVDMKNYLIACDILEDLESPTG